MGALDFLFGNRKPNKSGFLDFANPTGNIPGSLSEEVGSFGTGGISKVPTPPAGVVPGGRVGRAFQGAQNFFANPANVTTIASLGAALSGAGTTGERLGQTTAVISSRQAFKTTMSRVLEGVDLSVIPESRALSPEQLTSVFQTTQKIASNKFVQFDAAMKRLNEARKTGIAEGGLELAVEAEANKLGLGKERALVDQQNVDAITSRAESFKTSAGADLVRAETDKLRVERTETPEERRDREIAVVEARNSLSSLGINGVQQSRFLTADNSANRRATAKMKRIHGNKITIDPVTGDMKYNIGVDTEALDADFNKFVMEERREMIKAGSLPKGFLGITESGTINNPVTPGIRFKNGVISFDEEIQ